MFVVAKQLHVCACMCAGICECGVRGQPGVSFPLRNHLRCLLICSLSLGARAQLSEYAGWLGGSESRALPVSAFPDLGLHGRTTMPSTFVSFFLMWALGNQYFVFILNMVSTLLIELFLYELY